MKIRDIEDLKTAFTTEKAFIDEDKRYVSEINDVADKIAENREEQPIILLSGPSGSGKTTTAHIIEARLDGMGIETHTISLDSYFKTVKLNDISIDYESPERIDSDLLSSQIEDLVNCREVSLPTFDFKTAESIDSGIKLKRKKGELIIFEGIHALNPDVVNFDEDKTVKIFMSVITRVKFNDRIFHSRYLRLLRRMCRDKLFRGRSIVETVKFYDSVENGTEKFILPYKDRANYNIDTFIGYEPLIYKDILFSEFVQKFKEISEINKGFSDEFMAFCSSFDGKDRKYVPKNSLIREFIGEN